MLVRICVLPRSYITASSRPPVSFIHRPSDCKQFAHFRLVFTTPTHSLLPEDRKDRKGRNVSPNVQCCCLDFCPCSCRASSWCVNSSLFRVFFSKHFMYRSAYRTAVMAPLTVGNKLVYAFDFTTLMQAASYTRPADHSSLLLKSESSSW